MADVDETIEKLKGLTELTIPNRILSVYLSQEGKDAPSSSELLTIFHSLKHQSLTSEDKKIFRKDLEWIENYLYEGFFSGRGKRSLAFVSSGKELSEVFEFEFYLPPLLAISEKAYLSPIIDQLYQHEKYLVLLIDREKARLFTVHLGQIEEQLEIFDELEMVPQKVKAIKTEVGRDDKIPRHIEDHLNRHIKLIVRTMTEFTKDKNFQFIIIGGHKEIFEKIKKAIPYPYDRVVKGEFVTELNVPINDVFLKSKEIARNVNKKLPHRHGVK